MRIFACSLICLLFPAVAAVAGDPPDLVADYLEQLQSPSIVRRTEAAKRITGAALSDRRLFDVIDRMLREGIRLEAPSEAQIDEMAWLCKALAASGLADYRPALQEVADKAGSFKLRHYARQSLELIDDYAARNMLVIQAENLDPELSREENRYIGMLRSERRDLQRDAAKRIFRAPSLHPKIYGAVDESLQLLAAKPERDTESVETMAWLCKALGASGQPAFRGTLEKLAADEFNFKLQSHARKALEMLQ